MKKFLLAGSTGYLGSYNVFFSDMSEFFNMAKKGRVYLFGNGKLKANPIHGEDLAAFCVDAIDKPDKEVEIGGPETLTQNEIASIAFEILGNEPKITHIPDWVRVAILRLVRLLTGSKIYGPVEFFMTINRLLNQKKLYNELLVGTRETTARLTAVRCIFRIVRFCVRAVKVSLRKMYKKKEVYNDYCKIN